MSGPLLRPRSDDHGAAALDMQDPLSQPHGQGVAEGGAGRVVDEIAALVGICDVVEEVSSHVPLGGGAEVSGDGVLGRSSGRVGVGVGAALVRCVTR